MVRGGTQGHECMQAQSTLICCVYRSLNLLNARLVLDEALKARIREWGSLRKERDKELSSAQGDFTLPLYHPVKLRNSHCLVPPSSRAAPHAHSCPPLGETRRVASLSVVKAKPVAV